MAERTGGPAASLATTSNLDSILLNWANTTVSQRGKINGQDLPAG